MASSIFILDQKGGPIISRTYRGDIELAVPSTFARHIIDNDDPASVGPVFEHDGLVFVWLRHNDCFFVAVSKLNCLPALLLQFLRRAIKVFKTYFGVVTEESVRDNFVVVYELLDEMADFGFPQFTEAKILKEFIMQEDVFKISILEGDKDVMDVKALPAAVTGVNGASQFRPPGIKHRRNEVFLDVIETINLLADKDGNPLSSEIVGAIRMNVKLSGMPDVRIGLNDRLQFEASGRPARGKTVELEDIKFHGCVRLNRFEADRTISFCPPEGELELMTYRLQTTVRPLIQVETHVVRHGTSRVEVRLKAKSTYKKSAVAPVVEIFIPVPSDADSPAAKATAGAVKHQPDKDALVWTIQNFPGGAEYACACSYHLPSVRSSDQAALGKQPVRVKFEVPYFTVSGFQVRYLKVTEPKLQYETFPWVRYISRSGDYQIRTA